ncbi:uncharacterized protein LOC132557572 [Ylistrum balloti]|uniref:uncharacterized protein LOC132557572 n=1 Tax=Ylistrum balloti TaxID=509963 RepID=UPI002905DE28|nr:uncharacterized protein LOC132557572 [Ylistrum balloti]
MQNTMNGEDDIAVIDQQEDIDHLGYPVSVTDDYQSNSTLQLYISSGKPENDASLHALRNAYHDLKLKYNEQTAKVHSMRQAIKDMEAQRIQSTNRPFNMNTSAAFAGAAGAGNPTASGAGEANSHLRANLGYADSLQRQIIRLKNTSAVREKEMERKYSDLYTKFKRLEADVNTLQLRNRKTTVDLEKTAKLLEDRETYIEQLIDRNNVLEKKVASQDPESFSEESRLQEKHLMGIMEYQTQYIDDLKKKVQEQNSIVNKQLEMIKTMSRIQKEAEAAALRNNSQALVTARQPDGESLLPYNVVELQDTGARPRQLSTVTVSSQIQPMTNSQTSPRSVGRLHFVPTQQDTPVFARESLADVEARRKSDLTLHTNFADSRNIGIPEVQATSQLPVPQNSHDTPDSPVLRRSPNMSSPKILMNPSDSSYSMPRYPDTENQKPRLHLADVSALQDTIYQPSNFGREGPLYENDRLPAVRKDDKKLNFDETIYRSSATERPYPRLDDERTRVLYPPLASSTESNYENIKVFHPPTRQVEGDYVNVTELGGHTNHPNGSETQRCPVCNKTFTTKSINEFQQHVFDCMDGGEEEGNSTIQNVSQGEIGRECPMCTAVFPGVLPQEEFERHVQEHFGEDPMMERFEVLQA